MKVLITGSSGLVGSELVTFFGPRADSIVGVDNNMRADFFGREGDTTWNLYRLLGEVPNFSHADLDIRDRDGLWRLFKRRGPFDLVIHAAAQPSHDLAAQRSFDDFDVNAGGTVNVLQATRELSPDAVFVLMSTNNVSATRRTSSRSTSSRPAGITPGRRITTASTRRCGSIDPSTASSGPARWPPTS